MEKETVNQPSLINRSYARRVALEAGSKHPQQFTRVSKDFLDKLNTQVRLYIEQTVAGLPNEGKTIN